MKYVANPVEVDAFKIVSVSQREYDPNRGQFGCFLKLEDDSISLVFADDAMLARMCPSPGDYWVVQSGGYVYLNPKEVFERKYSPAFDMAALQRLRKQSA